MFRQKYTGASYRPCRWINPSGRKYKEPGECFSPASAGDKRSRRYLYSLLRVWSLLILQRCKRRTKIWIIYGTVWSFLIFRSFVFRQKYTGASYRPCRRRLPHGRKYKESGECFSPASVGEKRSRRYLYSLLRIWNL